MFKIPGFSKIILQKVTNVRVFTPNFKMPSYSRIFKRLSISEITFFVHPVNELFFFSEPKFFNLELSYKSQYFLIF